MGFSGTGRQRWLIIRGALAHTLDLTCGMLAGCACGREPERAGINNPLEAAPACTAGRRVRQWKIKLSAQRRCLHEGNSQREAFTGWEPAPGLMSSALLSPWSSKPQQLPSRDVRLQPGSDNRGFSRLQKMLLSLLLSHWVYYAESHG